MAEMSRRFNFDDFDGQIADALAENERGMADLIPIKKPRPGEIGGVMIYGFNAQGEYDSQELPPPDDAA